MQLPVKPSWGEVFTAAGVILGGGGVWTFLTARLKLRRSSPAAMASADGALARDAGEFAKMFGQAAGELMDKYRRELAHVSAKCDRLEGKVDACEEQHHQCEESLRQVHARLDEAREEIERLMSDDKTQPLPYRPHDLRRMTKDPGDE